MRAKWARRFLTLGMALGVGCGSPPPPGPVSTGSGAFGIITLNGKQLMYLPLLEPASNSDGQIAVVDVGQAGNGLSGAPALVTDIDLGCPVSKIAGFCPSADFATATSADADVVVAASSSSHRVWFIDPSKNSVSATISLDASLGPLAASAGNFIVTGVALDVANHRAILSVSTGFLFVDLNSHAVTGNVAAPGSENFGFDPTAELLVAPFYSCPVDGGPCDLQGPTAAGVNVVKLASGSVYAYANPAEADAGQAPLGDFHAPDSAAIDPGTELAVVPLEFGAATAFLDLSNAAYDDGSKSFTAPLTTLPTAAGEDEDGVAVEPTSHLAFFEQEFKDTMAVVDLTQLGKGSDGGFPATAQVEAQIPDTPGGAPWENLGDPHGVAVTTSVQGSKPVGFVVTDPGSGSVWVARVDLQQFVALGSQAVDAGVSSADVSGAVTMLDATTKE
ncbi:MAG TPA: hypothetical protein VMB50_01160 [Myxococcales bacterium]|nr:hypothetical protein [Myxococcales bacterium]